MRILPIIIVGFVFASGAFLVQPVHAQATTPIVGDVCAAAAWDEGACEQPLPDATVRLTGGPLGAALVDETTRTDEDGRFRFDGVLEGDYTLQVTRTGFDRASLDVSTPAPEQRILLTPLEVSAEGTLVDASGDAVSGARVHAWGPEWASDVSDDDGRFRLDLVAGRYTLEIDAGKRGYLHEERFIDGSSFTIELGKLPGQDAKVSGVVTDQDGEPVAGADVIIDQWQRRAQGMSEYGNFRNWTVTDADGRYGADVYSGSVNIRFEKADHAEVYEWLEVKAGQTATIDVELLKFPEKTARIDGKIVSSDGKPLGDVSISIQHPEYGLYTCSQGNGHGYAARPMMEPAPDMAYDSEYYEPHYYEPRCDITVHADGTFTGNVTPGYAIMSVWYDHYATCNETRHGDGHYDRECGADYFGYTETRVLQADAENPMTIVLRQRPMADATLSGYLVDGASGETITGAMLSLSNQETHGWGQARTDGDGSYRVRLLAGYHHVQVWADGYLPWQGVVYVTSDRETPLDITLTAGESRYGGCCYAYDEVAAVEAESHDGGPRAEPQAAGDAGPGGYENVGGGEGEAYEDLGGGLGPYDAAKRQAQFHPDAGKESPVPVVLAIVAMAFVALRRR